MCLSLLQLVKLKKDTTRINYLKDSDKDMVSEFLKLSTNTDRGAFMNDVTQILRISDPPPPSVTLKCLFYLQLYSDCHKRVNPPSPSCVMSYIDGSCAVVV